MIGLGTIINTAAIVGGGLVGLLFGRFLSEQRQDALSKACGVSTLFIGLGGALEGMLSVKGATLVSGGTMKIVLCLILGALIGELLNIEDHIEGFGEWLKVKTGSARDQQFVNAFVTASLTVCIGAMAIIGAIEDGIMADPSILITKATLDFVIVMVMTSSLGRGCIFSAIPVAVFQGSVTALARLVKPLMTPEALGGHLPDRLHPHFLRGGEPDLGEKDTGGQSAARRSAGGGGRRPVNKNRPGPGRSRAIFYRCRCSKRVMTPDIPTRMYTSLRIRSTLILARIFTPSCLPRVMPTMPRMVMGRKLRV